MKMLSRLIFSMICSGLFLAVPIFAAETNFISAPAVSDLTTQSMVNGYLQIQAQLHDAQLAIEKNREEAAAAAKQSADEMAARLQKLEDNLAAQRAADNEMAQKNQQMTLILAVAFGLIVVAAVLFMAYLQWRAVARLVELSARRSPEFSFGNTGAPPLMANAVVEQSNARLTGAVDLLQKRILELEQSIRAPLAENVTAAANGLHKQAGSQNGSSAANDRDECVANLLAEGQSLLDAQQPAKALECFEVALGLEPEHAEALVKKGGALEKLGRTDEAIACYDRAIAADKTLTIAHLHKGGLFNRLARYDEALQCYEQALRTQENKMPGEKIAA
ncbi:MAG TPA: tetratricopeptide repeat protein [Verrucomicrobiae bacterium]